MPYSTVECGLSTPTDPTISLEASPPECSEPVKATILPTPQPPVDTPAALQNRRIAPQVEINHQVDSYIDQINVALKDESLTLEQLVALVFCRARLQNHKLSKMYKEGALILVARTHHEINKLEKSFKDSITKGISIAIGLITIVASIAGTTLGASGAYQMLVFSPDNPSYSPLIKLGMSVVTIVTQGTSGLSSIQKPLNDRQQGKQTRLSELLKVTQQVTQQAHGSDRESKESAKKCADQLDQVFQSLHQATERVAAS